MSDKVSSGEGRLSRWSRRKRSKGGDVSAPQGGDAPEASEGTGPLSRKHGAAAPVPEDRGGDRGPRLTEKGFVHPMPPLAEPEDGEMPYEAAPPEALALLDPEQAALKAFPVRPEDEGYGRDEDDGGDIELTPEQEEAVRDLPPIDSLKKDSDFTPFFAPNVPDFLKRQAYKVLWMSSPFFGFRDGLDDYDENFRLIDKLITAADSDYKAGKGYGLEDDDAEDDVGDGDDGGDDGGETVVADAESGDENGAETAEADAGKAESEAPKEPRKSDVRPPDDAV